MNSVQLMAQAKELEKQEKRQQEDKDMKELVDAYVGKCFATSKFRQKSKATSHDAIYIQKIERLEKHKNATAAGTVVCYYTQISCYKDCDWENERNTNLRYTVGNYTSHLNSNNYNMFYNMHNLIDKKKEIPYSTFHSLFAAGEISNQIIEESFAGKINLEIEKTIGDSENQSRFEEACQIAGIELIDLEKHLPLLDIIRYDKLPGYVEDRYLIKSLAKISLETKIKLNKKEMSSIWIDYRRKELIEKNNQVIESYISKLKLLK